MKKKLIYILICIQFASLVYAQSSVSLTIDKKNPGELISNDFIGLSFETGSLSFGHFIPNAYFFDSTNTQLLTLFRNLGIKNLRIGGLSVEKYFPSRKDIDALFRFVKAADVNVIYSFPLANGDSLQNASTAKYIWDNYKKYLVCFAIGNEPNSYRDENSPIRIFASFVAKWDRFAAAILDSVPNAKFGGPDNGNGSHSWAAAFAQAEANNKAVSYSLSHFEAGGASREKTDQQIIGEMLSLAILSRCLSAYNQDGAIVRSLGFSYRFTEFNSHVAPPKKKGVYGRGPSGNHTLANALFALDAMHWWSEHGCNGVNFHTGVGSFNSAIFQDSNGNYIPYPYSYGIAAFNIGGQGRIYPVEINNPNNLNLTAYAVKDTNNNLYITIVNKEFGTNNPDVEIKINDSGVSDSVMYLKVPDNIAFARHGITLGGESINCSEIWNGKWTPIKSSSKNGCNVTVPSSSAVIIKLTQW